MSIFSNKKLVTPETHAEVIDEIVACEGYDITLGGHYDAIMESYDDDFAIIEAMHAYEMAELEAMKESGSEEAATPGMKEKLKATWDKIVEFVKKLGQRLMAFFKSAYEYILTMGTSNAAFVKKYKERLTKLDLAGFPAYEMYDYNLDAFDKDLGVLNKYSDTSKAFIDKIASRLEIGENDYNTMHATLAKEIDEMRYAKADELRKELAGDADKFAEALFKKFRKGGAKKSVNVSNLNEYIKFLETDAPNYVKDVKAAQDKVKTEFNDLYKYVNKAASESLKAGADGKMLRDGARKAGLMRSTLNMHSSIRSVYNQYVNAWSAAIKEASVSYKGLCIRALSYKKPEEAK